MDTIQQILTEVTLARAELDKFWAGYMAGDHHDHCREFGRAQGRLLFIIGRLGQLDDQIRDQRSYTDDLEAEIRETATARAVRS